jgi:hypothetical protein
MYKSGDLGRYEIEARWLYEPDMQTRKIQVLWVSDEDGAIELYNGPSEMQAIIALEKAMIDREENYEVKMAAAKWIMQNR